ncbi:MAG: acetylornithine transaminase [Armatimonadetes bacterium]|nr:acetylornithine transaminase [Armatimonadota bacterium]
MMEADIVRRPDPTEVFDRDAAYVMQTYSRLPVVFVRGKGTRLWDSEGREYIDFLAGISVCSVGHCHPEVVEAIQRQSETLMHVSNLFYNELQSRLAERLCGLTGMDRAFFANSGAEANECAIKIARKWGKRRRGPSCCNIITLEGSFHGRTLATVTATAQPKYQTPFTPLPTGFRYVAAGDLAALDRALDESVCAIMLEPIQGESGINILRDEYLQAVRALCDEAEVLLILDEVQSGMGRTGRFLASQHSGISGDIVTLAKALAGGVPMGVCMAKGSAAETLEPGDHGSTFGGQLLACAAAIAVLDVMEREGLMENAARTGGHFIDELKKLAARHPKHIQEVRGKGLMVGVELMDVDARNVRDRLLKAGVVVNAIGDRILRFLPPLTVTPEECDTVIRSLDEALNDHNQEGKA